MHFKLLVVFVNDDITDKLIEEVKEAGATGVTIIPGARGQGPTKNRSFFGLSLDEQRDMLLFLVEEHLSRQILELIEEIGELNADGDGVAFQIDVDDAVGLARQEKLIVDRVEDEL